MRILMIEDDDSVALSVKGAFEISGHEVMWLTSGWRAEEFIGDYTPDVVLCDWDLGIYDRRNGAVICSVLRDSGCPARFIIMSGLDREVPEWCEFVSKGNFPKLLKMVGK